ncbi:MAG TPA: transcriptional repressor LexA [Acidobacteriota bacterium]|nr:transcriptional repressor LexA [Acidobacteriota bacterium]
MNRTRRELTRRQKKVLEAVKGFIRKHGYSPTVRQLAQILGIPSPSAVFKHLSSIEKKGYLRKENGEIKLAGSPSLESHIQVPLAGLVPAGDPKEVFDTSEDAVDIPEWMLGPKKGNVFCVQVEGKSMVDAFIDDGDRVLLERTNTASSGEMVVAILDDGSITLKRLKLEKGNVFLVPENPEFKPIRVSELRIIGRVIGVLRKY